MEPLARSVLLDALQREAAALAEVARHAPADAPVPSCPGWDLSRLVAHLAEAFRFWGWLVEGRRSDPAGYEPPPPADADGLVAEAERLAAILADAADDAPVWS